MDVYDRSVLEKLSHLCLQDNTEIEVRIYKQLLEEDGEWAYMPPDSVLYGYAKHKAEIIIRNTGHEIDFDDVEIRVAKSEEENLWNAVVLFEDASFESETNAVDLAVGLLLSPDTEERMAESEKQVFAYFTAQRRIRAGERGKLFAHRVRATIMPKGHYQQSSSPQHDFERPIIAVPTIDFHKVTAGETSEKLLRIGNTGAETLFVREITTPASDVFSLDLPIHQAKLEPGESRAFGTITFSPSEEETTYHDHIRITSNDPTCPVKEVLLEGSGAHWFRFDPESLDFGNLVVEEPKVRSITLSNAHPTSSCTVSIMPPFLLEPLRASVSPKACMLDAGDSDTVSVTVKATLEDIGQEEMEKEYESNIGLRVSAQSETRSFTVKVRAYVPHP